MNEISATVEEDDQGLLFGQILFSVIKGNLQVYFVVRVLQSVLNMHLYVFSLESSVDRNKLLCVNSKDLLDYHPLPAYGRRNALVVPLKHAITFDFM